MSILIVTATKLNEKAFKEKSKLHNSLHLHVEDYPVHAYYENTKSLVDVYNDAIDKFAKKYDILLFVHDDVFIDSVNFYNTICFYLNSGYSVVGLAGGSKLKVEKPCLWHLMSNRETLSGIVSHYHRLPTKKASQFYNPTIFGDTPKQVVLLDGLFLAVKTKDILNKNIQFDSNIKGFHHYDLKFCLDCHLAGLKLITAPIHVIHESPGLLEQTNEFNNSQEYFYNFLKQHVK